MKKTPQQDQQKQRDKILASCERTRQACNKLTGDERKLLREKALSMIYGHEAKTSARSH
jgi:hypothetical protein